MYTFRPITSRYTSPFPGPACCCWQAQVPDARSEATVAAAHTPLSVAMTSTGSWSAPPGYGAGCRRLR